MKTKSIKYKFKCKECDVEFESLLDHGRPRVYCSRKCFLKGKITPEYKNCEVCDTLFLASKSSHIEGELKKYCSRKCAGQAKINHKQCNCANCGAEFILHPSNPRYNSEQPCCSTKCMGEFRQYERSHGWQGGRYLSNNGNWVVIFKRPGYVGKYTYEQRAIATKAIGRFLKTSEVVMHLNGIKTDNRPENLYICSSFGEFKKIHAGIEKVPLKSNLDTYQ